MKPNRVLMGTPSSSGPALASISRESMGKSARRASPKMTRALAAPYASREEVSLGGNGGPVGDGVLGGWVEGDIGGEGAGTEPLGILDTPVGGFIDDAGAGVVVVGVDQKDGFAGRDGLVEGADANEGVGAGAQKL